ncbi:2Fe-2S iron-sulfur cluster-binding protein [Paracoccus saliphilus]|uniref:(2Fe-2S)-binding protein n=1 Tax=Paracoccus saliphilus TaxID=405559 RepID=A0AA46A601_9RHOB|nr:2Fe-2S iron-sulfur cluster-binding protein [Paracoccus saliphilus]WCR02093.1 (2Fe-2S)-binding protein [Paracoccus saliphilus]SIS89924.1 sarcosine oxidase subunit alpha [Paracoccus saliphilus]
MSAYRLGGETGDLSFSFDGRILKGRRGDTLASALLANGRLLVGRSFKYHRPRGIFTAGESEPNALVTIGEGEFRTPNTNAATLELHDGMVTGSQNRLGSLRFDLLAINDTLSPLLGAGFYYKTFMWPRAFWERVYEPVIRRAAGLGSLSGAADGHRYRTAWRDCDLLVVGAGEAGAAAARIAAEAGLEVVIAEQDFTLGPAAAGLEALPNVTIMRRTCVFGHYDGPVFAARTWGDPASVPDRHRETLWHIHPLHAILATGAYEQSLVFPGNDRPGIMLASAAERYALRHDVAIGRHVAVFTNNDSGWSVALSLQQRGVNLVAVIDPRQSISPPEALRGIARTGHYVAGTRGRLGISQITLGDGTRLDCDALAVSGGWVPNARLASHRGGQDDYLGLVGGAAGIRNGKAAIPHAEQLVRYMVLKQPGIRAVHIPECGIGPGPRHFPGKGRAFVDLQNDVTDKDLTQARVEGFDHPEHLKRYTTFGMAPDQGKSGGLGGLDALIGRDGDAGPASTRSRPPAVPVPIGLLGGTHRGMDFRPVRRIPSHDEAVRSGASFVESGLWLRPEWFALPGEAGWRDSVDREVLMVRRAVGICDVSTLGKIDIQGRDAHALIDFVYANKFGKLAIGKTRYGLMLREDGMVMDDGTCARLGPTHFLVTTTTANAGAVYRHLEFCHQCLHPEWDVVLTPVTDQWAQFSVAGPQSREVIRQVVEPGCQIDNDAFPFMACAGLTLRDGTAARLFRISFSGELAYEIAVPAGYGSALWKILLEQCEKHGGGAYGTEALDVMRIEKGHPSGGELIGQTSAEMLGLGGMLARDKDYIGASLAGKTAVDGLDHCRLTGLVAENAAQPISAGAHLFAGDAEPLVENDLGWISSAAYSPHLQRHIALAFVRAETGQLPEQVRAVDHLRSVDMTLRCVSPHFIDPEGSRLRT